MENLTIIRHPVLQHKLTLLRNKQTKSSEFRRLLNEISGLLAYESTSELALQPVDIETPLEKMQGQEVKDSPIIVSIMRAGNGMLDGLLNMLPFAGAGHIGIYRDRFIQNTVEYYFRLPKTSAGKQVLLADPLLATGDTAIACVDRLKQYGVGKITMLCILVSEQGVEKLHHFHPDVKIIALSKERDLNAKGHLLPGLGDAGDRLYKTKDA
ncbi:MULTISPECIES: uracil phosphoribosyltransferase [Thalassomonas]|uniref:Uracil phosphoribosyltransferase n=1 Tax=Thalassomonas actiniarum TaxID=485447 RepID=A0AAE9YYH8_9GAMM|nr:MULTISPECIES: uracil phosphoribosyltransferase [Thalassomonas]WDE02689.1 uracil phosphoribosyltransferase [Thalassomonas actiniarum]